MNFSRILNEMEMNLFRHDKIGKINLKNESIGGVK